MHVLKKGQGKMSYEPMRSTWGISGLRLGYKGELEHYIQKKSKSMNELMPKMKLN